MRGGDFQERSRVEDFFKKGRFWMGGGKWGKVLEKVFFGVFERCPPMQQHVVVPRSCRDEIPPCPVDSDFPIFSKSSVAKFLKSEQPEKNSTKSNNKTRGGNWRGGGGGGYG